MLTFFLILSVIPLSLDSFETEHCEKQFFANFEKCIPGKKGYDSIEIDVIYFELAKVDGKLTLSEYKYLKSRKMVDLLETIIATMNEQGIDFCANEIQALFGYGKINFSKELGYNFLEIRKMLNIKDSVQEISGLYSDTTIN